MNCKCGVEIPRERLEALPGMKTCVNCSDEQAKVSFMVYSHKTAPEVVSVDPDRGDDLRQAFRAHRRSR